MMMATVFDSVNSLSTMLSRDSDPWEIQLMHMSAALIPVRWLATDNDRWKQAVRVTDSDWVTSQVLTPDPDKTA